MLVDPALVPDFDEDFAQCLNVLFDPEGKTCAVFDYPDQDWSDVWTEAAQYLDTFSGRQNIFLALACEGTIFVRVQDQPLSVEEQNLALESFSGQICISGKRVAVLDGMIFFDDIGISKKETISLREGCYSFTLYHLARHPSEAPAVGVFGSNKWPRIILMLQPAHEQSALLPDQAPNLIQLNTAQWVTEPITGALCMATVTKVSDAWITLELHLTTSTRSGYGHMPPPAKMNLKPHQNIVVRIGTNEGAYWSAEFVSKA